MSLDESLSTLHNESDVEQKIVLPLLTNAVPIGLGFDVSDFITKPNITNIRIGKGSDKKLYFPDYAVILNGIPSVIIEAKTPGADLQEALREARLYATEINSDFPTGVNPCLYILVSDGSKVVLSDWDSNEIITTVDSNELSAVNDQFRILLDKISKRAISQYTYEFRKKHSNITEYHRPTELLGGKSVRTQSVGANSFGSNISVEYRYLFNPESKDERNGIIHNAYVESKRRNSHISPIDKIVRAAIPRYMSDSIEVKNTAKPTEVTDQLKDLDRIKNGLCVLIGTVGSGKTTFTDYLRLRALPADLRSCTQWISINLNNAPIDSEMIYKWVIDSVLSSLKMENTDVDFDHIDIIQKVHHLAIDDLKKGLGSLYPPNSDKWVEMLVETLSEAKKDKQGNLNLSLKYIQETKNVHHIVVLDNCDKGSRDSQLLMFEVANWLKKVFPCTVFLPMRDTTYETYSSVPPLDTVIKDLVFRIDPPRLEKVLYQRLGYALREAKSDNSPFHYTITNGARVSCKRSEVSRYLQCVVDSLFQNSNFGRIVSGLAGRNIRLGLELVLNFCKSGHLSEDEIFKIRHSDGDYRVDNRIISRILFKADRMYYSDGSSAIRNLFFSSRDESAPNPFCRLNILHLLSRKSQTDGPMGYLAVRDVVELTQLMGHDSTRVIEEINILHNDDMLLSESLNDSIEFSDLITIGPAGRVHLQLLSDTEYLSTMAEDTLFSERNLALTISKNISGKGKFQRYSSQTELDNAITLLKGLDLSTAAIMDCHSIVGHKSSLDIGTRSLIEGISKRLTNRANNDRRYRDATALVEEYPVGAVFDATITSIQNYGFFVEFGLKGSGLIHKSNFGGVAREWIDLLEDGDSVSVKVIEFAIKHRRFDMELVAIPDLA